MPVIHALVARGADVLAEYSSTTGANDTAFELRCSRDASSAQQFVVNRQYLGGTSGVLITGTHVLVAS